MSTSTTLIGLTKPDGDDPFSRAVLNVNNDTIDKNIIAFAFSGVPYANCTKGALVKDSNGKPQSQTITGANGLAGSMTWSFTTTTITETLSITAPTAFSVVKTFNKTDLSEEWTVS